MIFAIPFIILVGRMFYEIAHTLSTGKERAGCARYFRDLPGESLNRYDRRAMSRAA